MKKLGALVPIRLGSERLPGKALKYICNRPVVYHLLDRICASQYVDKKDVVVCTTHDSSDDTLVDVVENYGASVFRGSTHDIIKRFYDAFRAFGFDAVIQVDGDDPLCDTEYMDLTLNALIENDSLEYVFSEGLPLGINSKSFTRQAMDKVFAHYKTEKNDTGFCYFFSKTGLCKVGTIQPKSPDHILDEARLTLDYDEDFEFFTKIIEALYVEDKIFDLRELIEYLKSNPNLMKINNGLDDEYRQRTEEKAKLYFKNEEGKLREL